MMAFDRKAPNSLIQLLFQSGADPHLNDGRGKTVLHYAVSEQNIWAIKWLVAENVDFETPITNRWNSVPVLQYLLDNCNATLTRGDTDFTCILYYLRAIQVLAFVWTNHVGNSFSIKQTQQLIGCLNLFIPKSIGISKAPCVQFFRMVEDDLREIREIVDILTDMLSHPFSLRHLCRVQIRRSLSRDFRKKLNQLNIPLPLQEYLKVYRESDIVLWLLGANIVFFIESWSEYECLLIYIFKKWTNYLCY